MKNTLLLILSFISVLSFSQGQKTVEVRKEWKDSPYQVRNYNFDFHVKGLEDSTVYLACFYKDKNYITDSTTIGSNGHYVFQGDSLYGGVYVFTNGKKQIVFQFVVSDSQIVLETDLNEPVKSMKVLKSEENKVVYEYWKHSGRKYPLLEGLQEEKKKAEAKNDKEEVAAAEEKIKNLRQEMSDYRDSFVADHPDALITKILDLSVEPSFSKEMQSAPDSIKLAYFKKHYWNLVDFNDARLIRTPMFYDKVMNYFKRYVVPEADSISHEIDRIVAFADKSEPMREYLITTFLAKYERPKMMCQEAVFVHLVNKYLKGQNVDWYDPVQMAKIISKAESLEPCLCGAKAKNIILPSPDGKYQVLDSIEAKFTVLFFWDSGCGHCKKTTPKLKKFYEDYQGKGVVVFAVNTESESEGYLKYIETNDLNWINVQDLMHISRFRQDYDITSTPVIYLLDENGVIIGRRLDPKNLAIIIDRELDQFDENKDYDIYAVPSSKKDEH